jgi:hypothetical protein
VRRSTPGMADLAWAGTPRPARGGIRHDDPS